MTSHSSNATMDTKNTWMDELETQRRKKDQYFAESPRSPLPPEERETFDGLAYYPVDPEYRFEVALDVYDEPEPVTVGTSTDGEQEYLAWGEFTVDIDGDRVTITAYRSGPEDARLWVPFRDGTSGGETYGAGRYLDLEPDHHRTDDGRWILDFNEAYNPTCAYSDRYECPLPPADNWLGVPIEAGEQDFAH
jgi:uncharacterized protein (DUF1684 family)